MKYKLLSTIEPYAAKICCSTGQFIIINTVKCVALSDISFEYKRFVFESTAHILGAYPLHADFRNKLCLVSAIFRQLRSELLVFCRLTVPTM